MRNAKHFLNMESMRSLYFSIFHSVVVYGIHVWSSTAITNLQGIILKQKAAVRTICGARYNDHTEPLFKTQKILPVEYLMDFFALSLFSNTNKDSYHLSAPRPGHLHLSEELKIFTSILETTTTLLLLSHLLDWILLKDNLSLTSLKCGKI
jgi:hypothetical protein